MLEVRQLSAAYGPHPALQDVSLDVVPGEIVVILGANGAGKSTLLRAISGICEGQVSGDVSLDGDSLRELPPDHIVERGIVLVPEGRGIFDDLTVKENLILGAYSRRARGEEAANLDRVLHLFPKLRERQAQIARTMSGGEQQMVAIGRAMMSAPRILMLDEPSLGLSPLLCKELFQNLRAVKALGIGILLVEQNARQSLAIADRGYLLENTRIVHEDTAERLATDPTVQKAYLGAGSRSAAAPEVAVTAEMIIEPPAQPVVSSRPQSRRTADQQIGQSVDDLVKEAAHRSATARLTANVRMDPPTSTKHESRLQAVVKDIERAAIDARKHPTSVSETQPLALNGGHGASGIPDTTPPPVIEIYRRPRVEIYRRRPSGTFERN